MNSSEANRLLESLIVAIFARATFGWALEHGDKLPMAWAVATRDSAMRDVLYSIWPASIVPWLCRVDCDEAFCAECSAMVREACPALTMSDVMRELQDAGASR